MADRISIDTQMLQELSGMLRKLQASLDHVHSDVIGSIQEARRVAPGQTGIIRKLENTNRQLNATAGRTGKLAAATMHAAATWEEAEKRVASQALPQLSGEAEAKGDQDSGTSGGGVQGNWQSAIIRFFLEHFGIFDAIRQNLVSFSHQNDLYRSWMIVELISNMMNGKPFSNGNINEYDIWHENFGELADTGLSVWNNDYISLSRQQVEIFGHTFEVLLPYINFGAGADGTALHGKTPDLNGADGSGVYLDANFGEVYAGSRFEAGFKDGEFVFHLGGGASATAVSAGVGYRDKYTNVIVSADAGAVGADVQIDYENGVLHVSGLIGLVAGVDADISVDIGKRFDDVLQTGSDIAHGDFLSAAEKLWDLLPPVTPMDSVLKFAFGNPITTIRSLF